MTKGKKTELLDVIEAFIDRLKTAKLDKEAEAVLIEALAKRDALMGKPDKREKKLYTQKELDEAIEAAAPEPEPKPKKKEGK